MWQRMIDPIPSLLGKLVTVASFRTGIGAEYRHPTLGIVLSPEVASEVLRENHEHLFAEWMGLFFEEQREEVSQYLATLPKSSGRGLLMNALEALVPAGAAAAACKAFYADLEEIMAVAESQSS